MNDGKPMDIGPVGISENGEDQEILTANITPCILEHGKIFRGDWVYSEFVELAYSHDMNGKSERYNLQLPVSQYLPDRTVIFGYWSFGPQSVGFVQAVSLKDNRLGPNTGRPSVQTRIGLVELQTLVDIYAGGIRPLTSVLVDAYPSEKPYLLQRYDSVVGQTDETWALETKVKSLWQIHQDEKYRQMAIRTTEAVLAKRLARIGNPVVLEHAGELTPQLLASLIDTVNVLSLATDPHIDTLSALNTASLKNYTKADLVVKDVSVPPTTSLYPSYIVNRDGNDEKILPGHYSTPAFKGNPKVTEIYDALHGSVANWVKNHGSILQGN